MHRGSKLRMTVCYESVVIPRYIYLLHDCALLDYLPINNYIKNLQYLVG